MSDGNQQNGQTSAQLVQERREQLALLTQQATTLKQSHEGVTQTLAEKDGHLTAAQERVRTLSTQVTGLEQELEPLRGENEQLRQENDTLRALLAVDDEFFQGLRKVFSPQQG
ncbi:MAG TPA: hypothetical protein VFA15_07180 [Nitrososphaera sp.]|nr:hypothetical protein [Nitrososphaera sp.]